MVLSEEDKVLIQSLRASKGWGAWKLRKEFPAKLWKLSTLNDFLKKLKETGSRHRRPGSGRPKSTRTEQNTEAVAALLLSQPGHPGTSLSERETAKTVGISRSSVQRIAKNDLNLRVYKRVTVQELSDVTKRKRLMRAKQLLRRFRGPDVRRICFTDEKIFTVATPRNSQNDRVHSIALKKHNVPRANLLREKKRSRASVMVSLGAMTEHKTSAIFVPAGVKINAVHYQERILTPMLDELRQREPAFVFQQDGAPSHTARSTIQFLTDHECEFIEPNMWPPCSPDLNPLDYFVWSALTQKVYRGQPVRDEEDLKRRIIRAWEDLPQESLAKAIGKWKNRLRQVVREEGGHIEHYLLNR